MRRWLGTIAIGFLLLVALLPASGAMAVGEAAAGARVYVLHIDGFQEITPGVAQITKRVFQEAEADPNAAAVAIVLDTPGGLLTSALEIKNTLMSTRLKTIVFVNDNALSAGALIGTAAEKLYMHQGSQIGAAEPRALGSTEPADYKTLSVVVAAFQSTAQARGRDPKIAQAMVDVNAKIAGQSTELLALTASDAVEKRYADGLATSLADALNQADLGGAQQVLMKPTPAEMVGRFLTMPLVATALLVIGVIAIGIEFMKPGVALPGLVGVTSLALFFFGHSLIGTANWIEVSLAILGIILLVVEVFVPGFGLFGIGGFVAVAASIFLAVENTNLAIQYLLWSSLSFSVALVFIIRAISQRGLGKALTLEHDEQGWVSSRADLSTLLGKTGKALTVLRPAGTAQFGSIKADVVTEGEYLSAGTQVTVLRVEGSRVVVRSVLDSTEV